MHLKGPHIAFKQSSILIGNADDTIDRLYCFINTYISLLDHIQEIEWNLKSCCGFINTIA